jgi:4-diphosphocytidyl-2-C-methyl-D-erythritol kinase
VRVPAYAKINLTLEVLGRRGDGYHEVKTILQTVDLADWLDVDLAPALKVECDAPNLNGDANLVWQAARELARSQGVSPGARIFIRKHIPVGMGLGGGSSDAAAALLALNRVWGLSLSIQELGQVAASVGSDVPFFLRGGTALGEGRGDEVGLLPPLARVPILLVCPAETLPDKTKRLYARITTAHYSDGGVTRRMLQTIMGGQLVVDHVHNVFESIAIQSFPKLSELCRRVEEVTGARPHLSGAGPAVFCLPCSEDIYQRVSEALQPYAARAYLVHAIMPPPLIT